jgi:hypothetical protein
MSVEYEGIEISQFDFLGEVCGRGPFVNFIAKPGSNVIIHRIIYVYSR